MKKTATRIITLCLALASVPMFGQLLTPELLYYKWDGTGTNVPNYASAPPAGTTNATLMGGLTQGTGNGEICSGSVIGSGNASTTDYVNTGWATNLNGMSWTISFRTQNVTPSATLFYIFGDINAGSFRCFTNGVAFANNWLLRGTNITDVAINGGATVAAHMCTYVYDIGTNTIYGYLDGVLVNTVAQPAGGPNISGAGPFKVIGYSTNVGMPSGGQMDEFRVYSRALTASEIATLYNPYSISGFLGSDLFLCANTSVEANLPYPAGTVSWSTGGTADSTLITSIGQVTVDITGVCGTGMDTIQVLAGETFSTMSASSCTGMYTAPSGAMYMTSGTYVDTLTNFRGCDSLITINLALGNNTTNTMNVVSCMSYTAPSGAVYTTSGTYMDTITNASGCDSVITINAMIGGPNQSAFAVTTCSSYTTPSGMTVTSSGTVQDTIPNMYGCDSVLTISVTINQPTTFAMAWTACNSYTAPSGAVHTTSGAFFDTIPNAAGCDSIISIQLTINTATSSSITASACDQYLSPSGIFLDSTGMYMDTIPNMAGCDSIITINLTMTYSTTSSMSVSACDSYTSPSGSVHTSSGTFNDIIPNMAGCDSIISISLTISTLDTTVTLSGTSQLQATQSGGTYQWIDCSTGNPIVGATSQTYTATQDGTYGCIVTNGSCSDTSGCHYAAAVGIEENFAGQISMYPNPNTGNFVINLGATYDNVTVTITDLSGRVVFASEQNSTDVVPVQLDAAAGSYMVTITSGDNLATFRIIKE